jgi:hypothetical protein
MDINLKSTIREDLIRFSKLHMWYKHLSYEGKDFLIFPWRGEQPKNSFDPQVQQDDYNLHWWFYYADFIDEIPIDGRGKEIIMQHSIKFNCFLRGVETDCHTKDQSYFRGWFLLKKNNPKINKLLRKKYPYAKGDINTFVIMEYLAQIEKAEEKANIIFKLLLSDSPMWLEPSPLHPSVKKEISFLSHKMTTLSSGDVSNCESYNCVTNQYAAYSDTEQCLTESCQPYYTPNEMEEKFSEIDLDEKELDEKELDEKEFINKLKTTSIISTKPPVKKFNIFRKLSYSPRRAPSQFFTDHKEELSPKKKGVFSFFKNYNSLITSPRNENDSVIIITSPRCNKYIIPHTKKKKRGSAPTIN